MDHKNGCKKQVPELLAPAGSTESLVAAVQSGADAVYLGLSSFNARASAQNFDVENIGQWVDYAHVRGVKVHVTLNTLVKDGELSEAVALAKEADKAGVDAFIVQDLGLAGRLAGNVRAELHASTQTTVYNVEGLRVMKSLGFDRAVLARELPLAEIEALSKADIIDTEAFCHGALCVSYSGQCMLSRFTSGRSGNRGTCAQPCRLRYTRDAVCDEIAAASRGGNASYAGSRARFGHLLSPADLCSLEYMEQLIKTGVSSLKIEGRLKSPEYVAAVTSIYRKVIDNPRSLTQQDLDNLTVIFSRGGFCSGHQLGKMPLSAITVDFAGKTGLPAGYAVGEPRTVKGPVSLYEIEIKAEKPLNKGDGITFNADKSGPSEERAGGVINVIKKSGKVAERVDCGDTASLLIAGKPPFFRKKGSDRGFYKNYDEKLYAELRRCLLEGAELKKVPLHGFLRVSKGHRAELCLTDNEGRIANALSSTEVAEASAVGKGLDRETALGKLSAFGGTPYVLADFDCEIEDGAFINFSELKAMRREATEKMTTERKKVTEA